MYLKDERSVQTVTNMGKAEFGIVLDDPYGAVFAGSNLRGKVWADIGKELQVTKFRGKFKAKGRMLCVVFEWSSTLSTNAC
jgi:hypothetical protein